MNENKNDPIPHIIGTVNTYSDHTYRIYGEVDYEVEQALKNLGMTDREDPL